MNTIKRVVVREREYHPSMGREWCALEVSLTPQEGMTTGRLSICGSYGYIVSRADAKSEALNYWESFFEDNPDQRREMAEKFDRSFRTAKSAARFVLEMDGEFHGLDVFREESDKVYISTACGQIKEELLSFFPEIEPYLQFHLNDMRAGCPHQSKLNWGHGKTIALDRHSATPVQLSVLDGIAEKKCADEREKEFGKRWKYLRSDHNNAVDWVKKHNDGMCSVDMLDHLLYGDRRFVGDRVSHDLRTFDRWLREDIAKDIKPELFEAAIYKDCLCAPCPDCGFLFGTEWLKVELPEDVVAWVKGLPENLTHSSADNER